MNNSFVSTASEQGKRSENEDRFLAALIESDRFGTIWLLAVIDGHLGSDTADALYRHLQAEFYNGLCISKGDIKKALQEAFNSLNARTEQDTSGSTLSIAAISENEEKAYIAILGDSPVIGIAGGEEPLFISPEHNAGTNKEEREAVIARGGERGLVYKKHIFAPGARYGLQVTRAFGNAAFGNIISKEPEIFVLDLLPESVFLLATDGIWKDRSKRTDEVFDLLKKIYAGCTARELVWKAVSEYSSDNTTAIIWRRNP